MAQPNEKTEELDPQNESRSFEPNGEEYEASEFGKFNDYFRRKKTKLQNSDAQLRSLASSSDNPQIFKGLVLAVNGYTNPSLLDLHRMIVIHGGTFLQYMGKKSNVSHIIASNLTPKKKVEFARYKVVKPEWITGSIAAGVLLSWTDFKLLDEVNSQTKLGHHITRPEEEHEVNSYKSGSGPPQRSSMPGSFGRQVSGRRAGEVVLLLDDQEEIWDEAEGFTSYQQPKSSGRNDAPNLQHQLAFDEDTPDNLPPPSHQPNQPSYPLDDEGRNEPMEVDSSPLSSFPPTPGAVPDSQDDTPPKSTFSSSQPESDPPPPAGVVKGKLVYEAECIIGQKTHPKGVKPKSRRGQIKYLIRWRGYPDDEATWEFERDLRDDLGRKELQAMVVDFRTRTRRVTSTMGEVEKNNLTPTNALPSPQNRSPAKETLSGPRKLGSPRKSLTIDNSQSPISNPTPPIPGEKNTAGEGKNSQPASEESFPIAPSPEVVEEPVLPPVDLPERGGGSEIGGGFPAGDPQLIPRPPTPPPQQTEGEVPNREAGMTAEEYNAILLSNPRVRQASVLNPGFLKNYYEKSCLHLSTWKAELRADMQLLAFAKFSESGLIRRSRWRRYIMHIGVNGFFTSVSTRDRPELKGLPVAITHGSTGNSPTSSIASCNYAARQCGLEDGMYMKQAKELCPSLVCLGYDFEKYEAASRAFYGVIFALGGERVEAVGVDEALVEVSNLCCNIGLQGIPGEEDKALEIARVVRDRCREATGGCEVSVGIGPNILLAKLATGKAKPAGIFIVKDDEADKFILDVEVRELPGIGDNIARTIEEKFKMQTVGQAKGLDIHELKRKLGAKMGEKVWRYCRGYDEVLVGAAVARRSISVDINWGVRFETQQQAENFVMDAAGEIERRMKKEDVNGRHLTIKINKRAADAPYATPKILDSGKCDMVHLGGGLGVPTCEKEVIGKEAVKMLRSFEVSPGELRGIGLCVTHLEEGQLRSDQKVLDDILEKQQGQKAVGETRANTKVQPRVTTLLDNFTKKTALNLEQQQPVERQQRPSPAASPMMSQFEIPSQVDTSVLEFLPQEMRDAVIEKLNKSAGHTGPQAVERGNIESPPNSQIDKQVWNGLAQEDRAEILAIHRGEQQEARPSFMQSPKKVHPSPWSKKDAPTSNKRPRTSLPGYKPASIAGILQPRPSNRPPSPPVLNRNGRDVSTWLFDEVDRSYFQEIDPASRLDIISQAEKHRAKISNLVARAEAREAALQARLDRAVIIPVLKRQTTLGPHKLPVGNINQIRTLLKEWYENCYDFEPYPDDVLMFRKFFKRLVYFESSFEKADTAVRYFLTLVKGGSEAWGNVGREFAGAVNEGLVERGMPPTVFPGLSGG